MVKKSCWMQYQQDNEIISYGSWGDVPVMNSDMQRLDIVQNLLENRLPRPENLELSVDDSSIFIDEAVPAPGYESERGSGDCRTQV
jgi:hypothetical protein